MSGENSKIKSRNEIPAVYKWNIEAMYAKEADWERDYRESELMADAFHVYSGRLAESAATLLEAFTAKDNLWQKVEKVYVYARMKKDEDTRAAKYQAMSDRAKSLIAKVAAAASFFTPELLEADENTLMNYLNQSEALKVYAHVIKQVLREKLHILSKDEENLMAVFSELTSATNDIFSMINNADIKFGSIEDEDGKQVEVTHGRYLNLMESKDRRVRKDAFTSMYAAYEAQRNTLAATYNYNTKTDVVIAKIRKYDSAIEAALSGDDIPLGVYDNLIDIVNKNLPLLHRYVELRRRALGLDEVHMYDLYTPLAESPMKDIEYGDALKLVEDGLSAMGEGYIRDLKKGIAEGWIDVYENDGKTSGAYSFGSYDSYPYVLLNYNGKLKDVFTIAHELGHSMHSLYTRRTQPFVYGSHSIFTAEVASTVNESLLMHHMLKTEKDSRRRLYLVNMNIENFRGTLFRQTMFAEFEKMTHQAIEKGEVLTADWLSHKYLELNKRYFGDKVAYDPQIAMEWARIPHFYNAFYVYKYATGFSAAAALTEKILKGGEEAVRAYVEFLKSGESDDPIPLLKGAGVDMSQAAPIESAMGTFAQLLDELDKMLQAEGR
ncbi:oligoendopeptidase F [Bacillota bacterium]